MPNPFALERPLDLLHPSTGLPSFGTLVCCYDFTKQMTQDLAPILRHPDLVGNWPLLGEMTSRPIYKTNVLNGRSVSRFDGVNDNLQSATNFGSTASLSGNPSFSVFYVYRKTSLTKGSVHWWGANASLQASTHFDNNSTVGYNFGAASFNVSPFGNNTWYVCVFTKSAGAINTTSTFYRNGSSIGTTGHSTGTPNINATERLWVGSRTGVGNEFQGDIALWGCYSGAISNPSGLSSFLNSYVGGVY